MSPTRRVLNRRGYLSEVIYDPARQCFREVPVRTNRAHPPHSEATVTPSCSVGPSDVGPVLDATMERIGAAHRSHLGYPYNLTGLCRATELGDFLINNLGDPYAGSHFASEVCALEREVADWFMDLWGCDNHAEFWGSVGASGTEGNLWALYLAREALPDAPLVYSADAHYSIPKAARILRMETIPVASTPDGAIDLDDVERVAGLGGPLIVALTCGTTVKGAHDDIGGALERLDAAGIGPEQRFVHVDGALNAMVLPFVDCVGPSLQPTFRHAIDSISTSGHKMVGTPMPCGVLVARRRHIDRVSSAIAYLRSNDTTLMGSRNGHAVISLWSRLSGHGVEGFRSDVAASLGRTDRLVSALATTDIPMLRNPHALTVVFPKPGEHIVGTYQLACDRGLAHAIVMPSVTDTLVDRFAADYLAWWRSRTHDAAPAGEIAIYGVAGSLTNAAYSCRNAADHRPIK